MPFVHPPTDTGPFVSALVLNVPPQTTMLGTSALMQQSEYVQLWAKTLGVKARVEDVPVDEIIAELPGGLGLEVAQTSSFRAGVWLRWRTGCCSSGAGGC